MTVLVWATAVGVRSRGRSRGHGVGDRYGIRIEALTNVSPDDRTTTRDIEEAQTIIDEHDIGVVTARASEVACLNRELFFHGDPGTFVETSPLANAYGGSQSIVQHGH